MFTEIREHVTYCKYCKFEDEDDDEDDVGDDYGDDKTLVEIKVCRRIIDTPSLIPTAMEIIDAHMFHPFPLRYNLP